MLSREWARTSDPTETPEGLPASHSSNMIPIGLRSRTRYAPGITIAAEAAEHSPRSSGRACVGIASKVFESKSRKRTAPIVAASTIGALKFKVIISAPCAPKIDLIEHRRHGRDHCSTRVWAGVHCRTVSVSASVQAALRGQPWAAPSSCVGAADCTAAAARISSI